MDYRPLDITVISASGLKNVNYFMKMDVYVIVSLLINGDSIIKQKTNVSNGDKNPRWSYRMKFSFQESTIQNSTLLFVLHSKRVLGDRIIGEVSIPIHELLENVTGSETKEHVVEYQVRSIKGKSRGTLSFSHKFDEKSSQTNSNNNNNNNNSHPRPSNVYAMQQKGVSYYQHTPYAPPQGYNVYPGQPQTGGGWYPPPYLHHQMGYGYSQQQPPVAVAAPPKSKEKKKGDHLGLGLGAGLIGGLLVGDMVSDACNYDV